MPGILPETQLLGLSPLELMLEIAPPQRDRTADGVRIVL
jgi:hypothetical protein